MCNKVIFTIFFLISIFYCHGDEELLIDSRIKTYLYQEGVVYNLTFRPNYQSIIEFQKNEDIEVMAFGDSRGWDIQRIDTKLFIKPLEFSLRTNLHIFTTKRHYSFDISSVDYSESDLDNAIYHLRFFYPENNIDYSIKIRTKEDRSEDIKKSLTEKKPVDVAQQLDQAAISSVVSAATKQSQPVDKNATAVPLQLEKKPTSERKINLGYSYSNRITGGDDSRIVPLRVFDDGYKTYFQFRNKNFEIPLIYDVSRTGNETLLNSYVIGDFVIIDTTSAQFALRLRDDVVNIEYLTCIFRDSLLKKLSNLKPNE